MDLLQTSAQHCPSCGEPIELTLDLSCGEHSYVEDCEVCCAPMVVSVILTAKPDAEPLVMLRREND